MNYIVSHFSINEMAKLSNLSIQTLRYYDQVDIFKPEYVNPDNRYRYYSFRQIADLDIIKYLKYMGASLEEIRHIMKMSPESLCEFLDKQEFTINEQIQKLNNIQKLLTHHKNHIREQTRINNQEFGIIYHRDIDERSVLKVNCNNIVTPLDQADIYFRILSKTLENEDTIMAPLCGYIYPLKNYNSIEKIHYSSLYTSTTKMDLTSLPSDVHVDSIPKGTYMCIAFKWSVTEYYKYFCKLKKAYDLLGLSKENNVYEVSVPNNYAASNDKDFITELQIKID
ncbi:MerR family transcriptional regulator [Paenibacillus polymyxa]|uniref:MerR family transcriptional regulator n=1 Tax=Paenibacillus polymyxa TaxID=1406 RepID=UPI00046D0CAC|nr:MerR family transcriptional regulator [Paenibacillus polymyxa]